MFKLEKNNQKIGEYLAALIEQNYSSRRAFCRAYICAAGEEPTNESLNNMSNRLSQIIRGKKALQTYDLPYFTELLGVSCEQLLSAGECFKPIAGRVTNYAVACSKEPAEWEAYIRRKDKLILNTDEYCKTVLDYALEFGNYEFIKFLMDNQYIWFDSREDRQYIQTFGAGTSIERRRGFLADCGLQGKLETEDALRMSLIALAADHDDIEMLNELRAREIPQLYYRAHYLSGENPDFDSFYNERTVKHIAASSEKVLDYFTASFEIRDRVRYKDGSSRVHTFLFPYISQLLDWLIVIKAPFAEAALKKATAYNQKTYDRLVELIVSVKNDEYYSAEYMKSAWIEECKENLAFFDNGNIVMLRAIYTNSRVDGMITNVAHVTKKSSSPVLQGMITALNASYLKIKNLKENLEVL